MFKTGSPFSGQQAVLERDRLADPNCISGFHRMEFGLVGSLHPAGSKGLSFSTLPPGRSNPVGAFAELGFSHHRYDLW